MKRILTLLLFLPLFSVAQDAPDSLTDQKWYPEYELVNGRHVPAPRSAVYGNHWYYFGKTHFFVDFKGPKKVKRGRWYWDAAQRAFSIEFGKGKTREEGVYRVRRLSGNRLELELPDKKIIGLNNGRRAAS